MLHQRVHGIQQAQATGLILVNGILLVQAIGILLQQALGTQVLEVIITQAQIISIIRQALQLGIQVLVCQLQQVEH